MKCYKSCIHLGAALQRNVRTKLEDPPDKDEGYGEHAQFVDASEVALSGVCDEHEGW